MSDENKKTILLVEDEAILALTGKMLLEQYGYNVLTADSGEKAVESSDKISGIDLVLMDINLGSGIDGTQAAEIILKTHDIPLVFLSSHTEPEVVDKTEKITSYGYVVKNSGITVLDASIKMAFKLFDAKKTAEERENHYRSLVEGIPGVVYSFSRKHGGVYYSSKVTNMLGYTPEQLSAEPHLWQKSVHPDDLPLIESVIRETLDGKLFCVEYRIRDSRGVWLWLEDRSFGYQIDGEDIIIEGFVIDITDRKHSEELLQNKMDELQRFLKITVGRELSMVELKKEVNELLKKSGQAEKYKVVE